MGGLARFAVPLLTLIFKRDDEKALAALKVLMDQPKPRQSRLAIAQQPGTLEAIPRPTCNQLVSGSGSKYGVRFRRVPFP